MRSALRDAPLDARLLGLLNVRYIAAEFPVPAEGLIERTRLGSTIIYENQFARPRAWVENNAARIITRAPDRIVVQAEGPGALVLSQPNYPGWRASVDGRAAAIEQMDSVLMGVQLEAGPHTVEFVFDPWTVKAGALVSGIGWSLVSATALITVLRGRRWKRAGR